MVLCRMVAMTAGMWVITVPLTFATVSYGWLGVAQEGPTAAFEQLNASWWVLSPWIPFAIALIFHQVL